MSINGGRGNFSRNGCNVRELRVPISRWGSPRKMPLSLRLYPLLVKGFYLYSPLSHGSHMAPPALGVTARHFVCSSAPPSSSTTFPQQQRTHPDIKPLSNSLENQESSRHHGRRKRRTQHQTARADRPERRSHPRPLSPPGKER